MSFKHTRLSVCFSFLVLFLFIALLTPLNAKAATLSVPADFTTIQAAINASGNGDEIIVSPGTYNESLNLNRSVTLRPPAFDAINPRNNSAIINGGGNTVIPTPAGLFPGPSIIGFQLI